MAKAWLIGGVGFLAVLLIASVAIVLTEEEEDFPEGSPENAVQRYLKATGEEDYSVIHSYLSSSLRDECSVSELATGRFRQDDLLERSRVTLEESQELDDGGALVTVKITEVSSGGAFGTSEWTHREVFALEKEDGLWRFSEYPWPIFGCPRFRPPEPEPTREREPTATPEPTPATQPAP